MKSMYRILGAIIIALYLLISIFTLGNYGINWDEVHHLTRGQAYLDFFLRGKESYDNELFNKGNRHSFYQIPQYDFTYQKAKDGDHPVLSDIASSFFNYVFYQKLGILNDFDAYHLYGPVLVFFFLISLFLWVERRFGGFTALVSILSLVLYPLFYGESHFNVQKDIPETVFYSLALISFYEGYIRKSVKWILLSAMFFGLALGTKFNIFFMPFIPLFWILIREGLGIVNKILSLPREVKFALVLYPIIGFIIFFFSWPRLWYDPVNNILQVFGYYRNFGVAPIPSMPLSYYFFGFNTYAMQWILYTTPPIILVLSFIGFLYSITMNLSDKNKTAIFVLLWILVPIVRVTIPGTSIYGGVRQIMEYIPAMAILAGVGANYIAQLLNGYIVNLLKQFNNTTMRQLSKRKLPIVHIIILLSFIPITRTIISMHPNESIYFNSLIGGLQGAKEKNIPGWGNSLGSTYKQGVAWLNENAENNAKVTLLFGNISNIPNTSFRKDIKYSNTHRSGPGRQGEYVIGVTHYVYEKYYHRQYIERFLDPVHEVKVDGVPILKIWKNDLAHTKVEFRKEEERVSDFLVTRGETFLTVDVKKAIPVTRVYVRYSPNNCTTPTLGYFEHSIGGKAWKRESGDFASLPFTPWFKKTEAEKDVLRYIFAAGHIRYIRIVSNDKNSCLLSNPVEIEVYRL